MLTLRKYSRLIIKLILSLGLVGLLVIIGCLCYFFGRAGRVTCSLVLLVAILVLLYS